MWTRSGWIWMERRQIPVRPNATFTRCPSNSWNKTALFRMHACSISTITVPFKILFQYGLVNTDIVTHPPPPPPPIRPDPFSPWHKAISTVSYRPQLVPNLSKRRTCASAKAINTPLRPWMVCLYRERYQYKEQRKKKFIKTMQGDNERKSATSQLTFFSPSSSGEHARLVLQSSSL